MRRPAHGATCKPGPCRPASGYGRPTGRPEPRVPVVVLRPFDDPRQLVDPCAGDRSEPAVPARSRSELSYSVISASADARSGAPGPVPTACAAINRVRSPWSLTLPSMNACIADCGLPDTKMSRAVS